MMDKWKSKRVLILGAARQGLAAARFLCNSGAQVTVNDRKSPEEFNFQREFEGMPIQWEFSDHHIELLNGKDSLCISGGVPLSLPIIQEAIKRRIPLTNDTQIFLEEVPCQTIGITGSAGKSTTTTLVGEILTSELSKSARSVWVGGNIGDPLLNNLNKMKPNDLAVLEISSFQLELMTISTDIAGVLNITPNHLDRHKSMPAYIAAKVRLIDNQKTKSISILGRDNPIAWDLRNRVKGKLFSFGFSDLKQGEEGISFHDGKYSLTLGGSEKALFDQSIVNIRGEHNMLNVMAAALLSISAGCSDSAIVKGIQGFKGIPHRLQLVRTWRGADWYNDSIATAPERTMAAILSFNKPIVLLLGGRDKDLPWEPLAELIHKKVHHVVIFGEASNKIEKALTDITTTTRNFRYEVCDGLHQAIFTAAKVVKPGDVVLFSPGGTSFDEFIDYEERGERFQQWVQDLS